MAIFTENRQSNINIQTATIQDKAQVVLNALGSPDAELSITIVSDAEIRELNLSYRNKDKATNVLSFAMQEGEFGGIVPDLLGDVVISAETAQREAMEAGITLDERMSQLLVHGILHLFGFDHEISLDDEVRMEKKSLELLRLIEPNQDLLFF